MKIFTPISNIFYLPGSAWQEPSRVPTYAQTQHTRTPLRTLTHTHTHKTNTHAFQRNNRNEWLITPAGIVNDLPRLRRPLGAFVGSIHSTI